MLECRNYMDSDQILSIYFFIMEPSYVESHSTIHFHIFVRPQVKICCTVFQETTMEAILKSWNNTDIFIEPLTFLLPF